MTPPGAGPIQDRASFREIRYANCWEDAAVVCAALEPLDGARCLSIASAGDNTLSLVARGARDVVAVDVSAAQLALLELKMAAFRTLDHPDLLAFLGAREASPDLSRLKAYAKVRRWMGPNARGFWDERPGRIARGVLHGGRLERYFRAFRRLALPLAHSRGTVAALLEPKALADRARFHSEVWDGWRWRALVRLFFSRPVMGLGRDREFLRHVEGPVAERILERARRALADQPAHDNPYLTYILTGKFGPALPDYLRPEHHEPIREGIARLRLWHGPVEGALEALPQGRWDAFNLSDVPEYMDARAYRELRSAVGRAAAPGARVAYWNLLVPRRRSADSEDPLREQASQGRELHARARTFFYDALVVEVAR